MAILKKDMPELAKPEARTVDVPELGGEVVVRPLLLSDYLTMTQRNGARKEFGHIAALLAPTVVDAEGAELFTVEEWEIWGGQHPAAAMRLWDEAWRLASLNLEDAEKKSQAQSLSSP